MEEDTKKVPGSTPDEPRKPQSAGAGDTDADSDMDDADEGTKE